MKKDLKKKFKLFLIEHDVNIAKLALKLGITYNYLLQIMNGNLIPSQRTAEFIEAITQGFIKAKELISEGPSHCPTCGKKMRRKKRELQSGAIINN